MSNAFEIDAHRLKRLSEIDEAVWINFPAAAEAVDRLLNMIAAGRRHDPECALLTGPSGAGKSVILRRVQRIMNELHQASVPQDCLVNQSFLRFETPPQPTPQGLLKGLLLGGGFPVTPSIMRIIEARTLAFLDEVGVQALGCDEFNRIAQSRPSVRAATLDTVKMLSNVAEVPTMLVGTPEAEVTLSSDGQMRSRYTVVRLKPWEFDDDFVDFLDTLEMTLRMPVRSSLADTNVARLIFSASKGITRDVCRIIRGAAKLALRRSEERICEQTIVAYLNGQVRLGRNEVA